MGTITKKILIIDDEAVFREAMYDALSRCGYHCTAEENAADAIKRLKTESFDLVLLDIMMDPLDGWDTLDHIKTLSRGQDTPVIMASAKKLQADEVIRYGVHVAGFLTKPFVDADFCAAVSAFFTWYDMLISAAKAAEASGVPRNACDQWIRLSREIKAIIRFKEVVSPRCIPEDSSTEEECLAKKMSQIDQLVTEKTRERDELSRQYPALAPGTNT